MNGLFVLDPDAWQYIYGDALVDRIAELVDFRAPPQTRTSIWEKPDLLRNVEVMFTGWGAPKMDEAFLDAAPELKAVFHGAGSVRTIVTRAFWRRGITITHAVAEERAAVMA